MVNKRNRCWLILLELTFKYALFPRILRLQSWEVQIINRGFPRTLVMDFLSYQKPWHGDVVMNPPFSHAKEHIFHALNLVQPGATVCALLKIQFLESISRKQLFDTYPLHSLHVYRRRIRCAKEGDTAYFTIGGAMLFAWYIWKKGYTGKPTLYWIDR